MRHSTSAAHGFRLAVLLSLLSGCSDRSATPAPSKPTRGEVFDAVLASSDVDSDGDGLPDDVEERFRATLGTDPNDADSDHDGVNDAAEVFGSGWIYFKTRGSVGALGAAMPAALVNDASLPNDETDSDGDGVADYLEFAGYVYDWSAGRFVLDPAGYHTDPAQYSTDQDAYGDGMEVSKINMDVAVRSPGDHPLVPAYPDIMVELTGYSVTLNANVETSQGRELGSGTTWSRENGGTSSFEWGLEEEVKASGKFSLTDMGAGWEVRIMGKQTWANTTSWNEARGGSTSLTEMWNQSVSTNPSETARLKLYVRVHNLGTAPATNVVPSLSLRIGGADVATFEPYGLKVAMLLPGGVFPPEDGVSWVVDATSSEGTMDTELTLTDWELRALESGAPVSISVPQVRADVMRLTREGAWERVGDTNDYLARILSTSTDVYVDPGPAQDGTRGQFLHSRVASDDSRTAPVVTLEDALRWTMGLQRDPDGRVSIARPLATGGVERVVLAGGDGNDGLWRWRIDPATIAAAFGDPATVPPDVGVADLLSMRLGPTSQVAIYPPRALEAVGPVFHSAYAQPIPGGFRLTACASDYDGIDRVEFVDAGGIARPMTLDGRGPWFYSLDLLAPLAAGGPERLRAVSRRTREIADPAGPRTEPLVTETPIAVVAPRPPTFENAWWDAALGRVYVQVIPATARAQDQIASVRLFSGPSASIELPLVANAFEDPHAHAAFLPAGWKVDSNLRLAASTVGSVVNTAWLASALQATPPGKGDLRSDVSYEYAVNSYGTLLNRWVDYRVQLTDFDREPRPVIWHLALNVNESFPNSDNTCITEADFLPTWKAALSPSGNPERWSEAAGLPDVYFANLNPNLMYNTWPYLGFFRGAARWPVSGAAAYGAITRADIAAMADQGLLLEHQVTNYTCYVDYNAFQFEVGDTFVFLTSEGRLAKLNATSRPYDVRENIIYRIDSAFHLLFDYQVFDGIYLPP
jgi:hypothetical protein